MFFIVTVPPQYTPQPNIVLAGSVLKKEYKEQWEHCDRLRPMVIRSNGRIEPISRKRFLKMLGEWIKK